ncbi:MAG: cation:proton antiporter subunit C [Defluviitaleaceae bacterium]|nr:cation:proton antiporter subunit C [Defluviitaleaceae bacterium]MCL2836457.1 cation:proton antiporter subunit C [Defluviitaleaceae bacterium]
MRYELVEIFSVIMFFISFYGLLVSKSIIKSIVFMVIMESAVIMFFLSLGYRRGIYPPIDGYDYLQDLERVADPLPQALMITAIVIGLSVTAVKIVMLITMFRKYGTTDWETARKKSLE